MKKHIKQFIGLILILAFGTSVFAHSGHSSTGQDNFQTGGIESNTTYRTNRIPPAIFDRNFRHWQPAQPVPLIAAPINDIMMTDGARIFYNPIVVNQTPAKIVAFFLAHEYGHIYGRTSSEFDSDQFAARVYAETDISVVKAAVWHFYNIQGNQCNSTHGCGWQRAVNIGQTAGFSEREFQQIIRGNF